MKGHKAPCLPPDRFVFVARTQRTDPSVTLGRGQLRSVIICFTLGYYDVATFQQNYRFTDDLAFKLFDFKQLS